MSAKLGKFIVKTIQCPKSSHHIKVSELRGGGGGGGGGDQGPVVQSIVSLMSLLRGQLVKCFTT